MRDVALDGLVDYVHAVGLFYVLVAERDDDGEGEAADKQHIARGLVPHHLLCAHEAGVYCDYAGARAVEGGQRSLGRAALSGREPHGHQRLHRGRHHAGTEALNDTYDNEYPKALRPGQVKTAGDTEYHKAYHQHAFAAYFCGYRARHDRDNGHGRIAERGEHAELALGYIQVRHDVRAQRGDHLYARVDEYVAQQHLHEHYEAVGRGLFQLCGWLHTFFPPTSYISRAMAFASRMPNMMLLGILASPSSQTFLGMLALISL